MGAVSYGPLLGTVAQMTATPCSREAKENYLFEYIDLTLYENHLGESEKRSGRLEILLDACRIASKLSISTSPSLPLLLIINPWW